MIIVPAVALPHPDHLAVDPPRPARDLVRDWEWLGFQRIQLVEPTSRDDRPLNRRVALDLLHEVHVDVQVAGDIRSSDDIEELASAGAYSVVLGPRAIDEPDWLTDTVAAFPDMLIVETSARERRLRSRGAVRTRPIDVLDLAAELSDLPLAGLMVTFGLETPIEHADLALVEDLTERLPFPLFVSGGAQTVGTLRDLEFRGVAATIIDAARIAATFDEQTLARSFVS